MKRSPLKRTTPLKRTGGLSSGAELRRTPLESRSELKRTKLKPRSAERSRFMAEERVPLVKALNAAGERCTIGPIWAAAGMEDAWRCQGLIEGIHERRKRSAGGSLINPLNLMPACNWCNGAVEDNPLEAQALGLVVRQGDPEWEALGARQDRLGNATSA